MSWEDLLTKLRIVATIISIAVTVVWLGVALQLYDIATDETALDEWRDVAHNFAVSLGEVQIVISNQTDVQMCNGTVIAMAETNMLDNSTNIMAMQPSPANSVLSSLGEIA